MTIDIGKLHAGDSVKLSNGNTFKVSFVAVEATPVNITLEFNLVAPHPIRREPRWTIVFEGGLQLSNLNTDGSSQLEYGISVIEVYPVIDLSTVKIGDTLITRTGLEIPWDGVLKSGGDCVQEYIVTIEGVERAVSKRGLWSYSGSDSEFDIVRIRRALPHERENIAKNWQLG